MNNVTLHHDKDSHKCYGEREGNWIVFRCPICHDYERRINILTGNMESTYDKDNNIPHYGFYVKPGLDNFSMSNN